MPHKKNAILTDPANGNQENSSHLISPEKKSEAALLRLERLLLQAEIIGRTGSWEWDTHTGQLQLSAGFFNIIQCEKDNVELNGDLLLYTIIHPGDQQLFKQLQEQLLQTGQPYETTTRLIRKNNETVHVSINAVLEQPGKIVGTVRDITKYITTADSLKINEKRLHAIMEHGTGALSILTIEGKPLYVSPSIKNVLGYTVEEAMQLDLFSVTHPDDREEVAKKWQESIDQPGVLVNGHTSRLLHKDGSWRWLEDTIVNMLHDPDIQGIVDNFHDVTERVDAINEALHKQQLAEEAEISYRQIFEKGTDGILILDIEGIVALDANQKACEILGCTREELLTSPGSDFITGLPDFSEHLFNTYFENAVKHEPQCFEWVARTKTGNFTWIEINLTRADIAGAERILCFIKDINTRKSAEEAKAFEQTNKEALINSTEELIWSVDKNLQLIAANSAFIRNIRDVTGKTITPGDHILKHSTYSQEYLALWRTFYERALTGESFKTEVYTPPIENLSERWAEVSFNPMFRSGEVIGIACYRRETTEAHLHRTELLKTNRKLETAQQIARLGYWEFDVNSGDIFWSNEVYAILGLINDHSAIRYEKFLACIHAEDRPLLEKGHQLAISNVQPLNVEHRIVRPNGEVRYVHEKAAMVTDPHGNHLRLEGTMQDITERKLSEASERALEKRFEAIFNQANDAILLADDGGHYVQANPAAANMLGYTQTELLGLSAFDIAYSSQPKKNAVAEQWEEFRKDKRQSGIIELQRKNGMVIICQFNAVANILPGLHLSIITDITGRENSRREVEKQRKYIDTILNSITDGFFSVDKNWTITYWNHEAERLLLRTKEELLGKNLWEEFKDAISLKFYSEYHRAVEQNISVRFEEYFPPLNLWLGISAYPSAEGLAVYFQDISERKRVEEELRLSMERYDVAAKATTDSIWDWNLLTNEVTRPGNLLETYLGYEPSKPGEVMETWRRYAHPEDWKALTERRNAAFADPTVFYWEDEYRFLKPDGKYAFIYARGYVFREENGKAIRMIGATKDISKRKEQMNEILRIQQNLDSLINTTTDLIWSVDTHLKIIAANKAYNELVYALTGKQVKEGDLAIFDIPGITQFENWNQHMQKALGGETVNIEKSFLNPVAQEEWHSIATFSPIIDKDGNITGVACYEKNITELKSAGKKLEELNAALEIRAAELAASNSELERFAYVASHDLQEPLRMVTSFLQLLQKKYKHLVDETAARYIHFSIDGADRMKLLINDLLQYSRAGTIQLELTDVDMNEIAAEVIMLYKNDLPVIHADIIVKQLPVIKAGKSAMLQLLQNLVGNALKYRDKEKTVVTISCEENIHDWIFTIEDNGIGIDIKFNDKIFVIFQRLHNKDEYTGTGIGLAICKKIVERYQGRIWVESEPRIGSKFIFTIPKSFN